MLVAAILLAGAPEEVVVVVLAVAVLHHWQRPGGSAQMEQENRSEEFLLQNPPLNQQRRVHRSKLGVLVEEENRLLRVPFHWDIVERYWHQAHSSTLGAEKQKGSFAEDPAPEHSEELRAGQQG